MKGLLIFLCKCIISQSNEKVNTNLGGDSMDIKFTSNRVFIENAVQAAKARALEIMGGKAEGYAKQLCPVAQSCASDSTPV